MNVNELADTIELMCSSDYKKRFLAEYLQLEIRSSKLEQTITKYETGMLNFKPTCPISILKLQLTCMLHYMVLLRERAKIEDIELP